jgi:hypothetical protein
MTVISACSSGEAKNAGWAGTIDTLPNGAVHVANPDRGIWDSATSWHLVEATRIGAADGDGPNSFSSIRAIAVDPGGRIYVMESESQEIRVFDSTGTYVRTIGHKGSGPGEIKDGVGMGWDRQGRLWVVDQDNGRFSVFDTTGSYIASYSRLFTGYKTSRWVGGILNDSRLVDWMPPQEMDKPSHLVALDSAVRLATDTFELPDFQGQFFEVRNKTSWMRASVPYAPYLSWLLDPKGFLWFGTNDRYRLYRRELSGDTVLVVDKPFTPVAVSGTEKDSAIAQMEWFTQQGGSVDVSKIPSTKPVFTNLLLDEGGNLWVTATIPGADRPTHPVFDIFDPTGRYLGRLEASFAMTPYPTPVFRDGQMYAISPDSMDVPFVVRARVERK